jgi:hypothetical protein
MKLIGSEKMPPSWAMQLEELIVCAITGGRCAVVEMLDGLVKGYRPNYEFHGVAVPDILPEISTGADLPADPAPSSGSVH